MSRPFRNAKAVALASIELSRVEKVRVNKKNVIVEREMQYVIVDLDVSDYGDDDEESPEDELVVDAGAEEIEQVFSANVTLDYDADDPVPLPGQPKSLRWRRQHPKEVNASYERQEEVNPCHATDNISLFKRFFSDTLLSEIAAQTNLYSTQQTAGVSSVNTNKKEIEVFIGTLLKMGIFKLPKYRMYWSPATRIPSIADYFDGGVKRFAKLKQNLHFNDVADTLMRAGKSSVVHSSKRGRPPTAFPSSSIAPAVVERPIKRPCPASAVRYDNIGHFPNFHHKQQKCAAGSSATNLATLTSSASSADVALPDQRSELLCVVPCLLILIIALYVQIRLR